MLLTGDALKAIAPVLHPSAVVTSEGLVHHTQITVLNSIVDVLLLGNGAHWTAFCWIFPLIRRLVFMACLSTAR